MATPNSNAAPTGRNIACPECDAPNEDSRRFCGNCGQRLWEPCGACQEPSSRSVEFCGSCGANLKDQFDSTRRDITTRLQKAGRLRSEGRYQEAITELSLVPATEDSRLLKLIQDIPVRIQHLTEEHATGTAHARQTLKEALQLQENGDHVGAANRINEIPLGLRTSSIKRALKHSQLVVDEIRILNARIRNALTEKRTHGLLPDVLKLMNLQPGDEKLATLAFQLQKRQQQAEKATTAQTIAQAKVAFSEGKYAAAARLLAGMDIKSVAEKSHPLYHTIREIAWNVDLIRNDPFLTENLLTVARRWQKMHAKDPNASRAVQDLTKLMVKRSKKDFAVVEPRGSRPAEAFGVPVYWWRKPRRAEVEEEAQAFQKAPTRFMVAFGLALQGLGLAHVKHNLLPKQEKTFFSLPKLRKNGGGDDEVWGVDLGASGLKAILLKQESGDVTIQDAYYVSHADAIGEATHDAEAQEVFRQSLQTWIEDREIAQSPVVLGLPGPRTLVRTFEIPNFRGKKAADAIAYETKMQIPMSIEDIHYDWHAWPSDADEGFRQVTLVAARQDHVQHVLGACEGLPLRSVALQSACLALYNAAIFDQPDATKSAADVSNTSATGILDLGAESSTLVVASPDYLRFRSVPVGTHRLDQHLVTARNLTRSRARFMRTKPEAATWLYDFDRGTREVYGELLHEVRRTLRAYVAEGIEIDRILVTGGASEQIGMLRFVASQEH